MSNYDPRFDWFTCDRCNAIIADDGGEVHLHSLECNGEIQECACPSCEYPLLPDDTHCDSCGAETAQSDSHPDTPSVPLMR